MISTVFDKVADPVPGRHVRKIAPFLFLLTCLLGTGSGSVGHAYDDAEAQKTADYMKKYRFESVTTKEGLTFSVPSDMPIERKNGLVQPIPYEEYLYIKFKLMEERMRSMEVHLDKMEEKMLKKFDELKAQIKALDAKLDTPEAVPTEQTPS